MTHLHHPVSGGLHPDHGEGVEAEDDPVAWVTGHSQQLQLLRDPLHARGRPDGQVIVLGEGDMTVLASVHDYGHIPGAG